MSIHGNSVGNKAPIKTLILVDENGNELTGVITGSEVIFDATANDVREGKTFASNDGIQVGKKVIPPYYASYGSRIIAANSVATIPVPEYQYSYLMVVICPYNVSEGQSVVSTYISIGDAMYVANSNQKVSDIVVDVENEQINLGIIVSEKSVLRYCVIKEE